MFDQTVFTVAWAERTLAEGTVPSGRTALWAMQRWWVGIAAAAAAGAVLAVPLTRQALAAAMNVFRPRQVAAVPMSQAAMNHIAQVIDQNGRVALSHYGSVTTRVAPRPLSARTPAAMAAAAGLPNIWPAALSGPGLSLQGTGAGRMVFALKVQAINQLIAMSGGSHLFPASLNGVPITLVMRPMFMIADATGQGRYTLDEAGVPSLAVPGRVATAQVASAIASLPFLPANVRATLATMQTGLSQTVVLPTAAATRRVTFRGQPALLETSAGGVSHSVIWIQNGVFYRFQETARSQSGALSASAFLQQAAAWLR